MWQKIDKHECDQIFKSMHRGKATLFAPLGHGKIDDELAELLKKEEGELILDSSGKEKVYKTIIESLFSDIFYLAIRSEIKLGDRFQRLTVPVEKNKLREQLLALKYIFASVKPYFADEELIFFSVAACNDLLFTFAEEAYKRNDIDKIHGKILAILLPYLSENPTIEIDEEALSKIKNFDAKRKNNKYKLNNSLDELKPNGEAADRRYYIYSDNESGEDNQERKETVLFNRAFSKYKLLQSNELHLPEKYFLDNFKFEQNLEENLMLIAEFWTLDEGESNGTLYILNIGKIDHENT